MTTQGIVWQTAGGYRLLDLPDGYTNTDTYWSSSDASIVVGYISGSVLTPARWSGTTFTPLVDIANMQIAFFCNQDGSVILGAGNDFTNGWWTDGGATGAVLSPLAGDQQAQIGNGNRLDSLSCSDDGSIIIGRSLKTNSGPYIGTPCYWLNGVPVAIGVGGNGLGGGDAGMPFVTSCSIDGSVIVGYRYFSSPTNQPLYWKTGSEFPLVSGDSTVSACNVDATILYSLFTGYWDNVTTLSGGFYGTTHSYDTLAYPNRNHTSTSLTNVTIGTLTDIDGVGQATKWTGTSAATLPAVSGRSDLLSYNGLCVSSDGTQAAGIAFDVSNNNFAVYWDATNTASLLEVPIGFQNPRVNNFSRDGSAIFGTVDVIQPPPPFPATNKWTIASNLTTPREGGIGDQWMDQQYVDFSDETTRRKFINADKSWVDMGQYGDVITPGAYPLVWNAVQAAGSPSDFTYGWGQNGWANGWDTIANGNDPTTGQPYPDMSFDLCLPTPPPTVSQQPVMILGT